MKNNFTCILKTIALHLCKEKSKDMFREKVKRLINEYGIKQNAIIELIESNRVAFPRKIRENNFSQDEQQKILNKYGSLL